MLQSRMQMMAFILRPSRPMFFTQQMRTFAAFDRLNAMQVHNQTLLPFTPNYLWDNPGAKRDRKRIGRGPGSGLGKTAGKGNKGQG